MKTKKHRSLFLSAAPLLIWLTASVVHTRAPSHNALDTLHVLNAETL